MQISVDGINGNISGDSETKGITRLWNKAAELGGFVKYLRKRKKKRIRVTCVVDPQNMVTFNFLPPLGLELIPMSPLMARSFFVFQVALGTST